MAFEYLKHFGRLNGTPEKRTQTDLNRVVQPIQRKLMAKMLNFIDRI